jgi:tRNA A-37 threonylcarbamoyl transferase component Bud32/DNA-directed RNA polymerase specialized sigma24 family protein
MHMPTASTNWTRERKDSGKIPCMTDTPSAELLARYHGHRDEAAAEELFRRYVGRLTARARSRLSRALAARVDPEDVVQSAYRSFFLLAGDEEVLLRESGDLWRLLVRITLRKVYRSARRHRADCRSVEREHPWPEEPEAAALSREPTPAEAAALVDELRGVLTPLGTIQRRIVEMRLQGHEIETIAAEVRRSARTVRRTLAGLGAELERRLSDAPQLVEEGLLAYSDVVLLRQLGQGGMGKVYRATWRGSDVPVAVKLLRKPLRGHQTAAARFREEASLLSRLRHPGIVAVHGIGLLPDGGHFLVMDLIEGSDLARQPCPSVVETLRWAAEAAEAIEYAHRAGVVHCDLKPSNLLLGRDGHVVVTDFGLARSLAGDDSPHGGTAGFMAPEQSDPEGRVSPRTDVYGLGAVLHALLPERSPEVDALCRRCLAEDPEARYAAAAELASALRALLAEPDRLAHTSGRKQASPASAGQSPNAKSAGSTSRK